MDSMEEYLRRHRLLFNQNFRGQIHEDRRKASELNKMIKKQKENEIKKRRQLLSMTPLSKLKNPQFILANLIIVIVLGIIVFDKTLLSDENENKFYIKNSAYALFSFFVLLLFNNTANITNVRMQHKKEFILSALLLTCFGFLSFSKDSIKKIVYSDNKVYNQIVKILSDLIFIYVLVWKVGYSFVKGFNPFDFLQSIRFGMVIVLSILITTIAFLYKDDMFSDEAKTSKVDFVQRFGLTSILASSSVIAYYIYHLNSKKI